jgi:hypothetical protein
MLAGPLSIFCSYSHKDERWRQRLETHLAQLKNEGVYRIWHDRQILAGAEWADDIDDNFRSADIILLLVSADFLASSYCMGKEVELAMKRHEEGSARVVPIILRPCDWHTAPFGKLQALPRDGKPIQGAKSDDLLHQVAQGLRSVAAVRKPKA